MPFYEIVYESGLCSVAECDSDEEVLEGAQNQHERATKGQAGGPAGDRAERVVKVLRYEKHPDKYNADQTLSAEVLSAELKQAVKDLSSEDGVVHLPELISRVRDLSNPTVVSDPHESQFKMKESKELVLPWL